MDVCVCAGQHAHLPPTSDPRPKQCHNRSTRTCTANCSSQTQRCEWQVTGNVTRHAQSGQISCTQHGQHRVDSTTPPQSSHFGGNRPKLHCKLRSDATDIWPGAAGVGRSECVTGVIQWFHTRDTTPDSPIASSMTGNSCAALLFKPLSQPGRTPDTR
jgi:hypothetical protein